MVEWKEWAMSFNIRNLEGLGKQIDVPIKPDEDGYVGRECPIESCLGYFKITVGTGLKGPAPCHCPYCGHSGSHNTFWTQEQLEYAKSIALRQITDALHRDLKGMEFDHKPRGGFGIGISLKVTHGQPHPIRYYREKKLETSVICDNCTLRYAIYGVFGWCPDCGVHNSRQILAKNLELAEKELVLSDSAEGEMAEHLIGDALENAVSAFDGFGRAISSQQGHETRFQSLAGARRNVLDAFGFDFADVTTPQEWDFVCRMFQKRHLLSHRMGVIDHEYVQKANDPIAMIGRKIVVTRNEVETSLMLVRRMGNRLYEGIFPKTVPPLPPQESV
jgi:hypothetical protein